jgi:hypothetical protein
MVGVHLPVFGLSRRFHRPDRKRTSTVIRMAEEVDDHLDHRLHPQIQNPEEMLVLENPTKKATAAEKERPLGKTEETSVALPRLLPLDSTCLLHCITTEYCCRPIPA